MKPGARFCFILTAAFLICWIWLSIISTAAEYYRWVDRDGNPHFSDSIANIPEEYLDQATTGRMRDDTSENPEAKPGPEPAVVVPAQPEPALKKYTVPYQAYEGMARRIIVQVRFNNRLTVPMALDTGAPGTVISASVAERLGILEPGSGAVMVSAGGIGGMVPAVRAIIDSVQIGEARDTFVPITVVKRSISGAFEGLIGMDFMSRYTMQVDMRKHVVDFQELPKTADMPGGHDEEWWRNLYREFAAYKKRWGDFRNWTKKRADNASGMTLTARDNLESLTKFAEAQYREADTLFSRLNGYAVQFAVPMEWRRY